MVNVKRNKGGKPTSFSLSNGQTSWSGMLPATDSYAETEGYVEKFNQDSIPVFQGEFCVNDKVDSVTRECEDDREGVEQTHRRLRFS